MNIKKTSSNIYFSGINIIMKRFSFTCFILFACTALKAQTTDTTAIKQLLEKESVTWRSGDEQAHADCWHIHPYSKILISTTEGQCYDVPPETMAHPPKGMMDNGGSFKNSNYVFSVHGDNAWVCHDEISTSKDGIATYSHEMKMLEKINNEWKIVAVSIHLYKP